MRMRVEAGGRVPLDSWGRGRKTRQNNFRQSIIPLKKENGRNSNKVVVIGWLGRMRNTGSGRLQDIYYGSYSQRMFLILQLTFEFLSRGSGMVLFVLKSQILT